MKTSFKKRSVAILTLLALALFANGVTPVHGATFIVSKLNDSGAGSLRQAILDANAAPGADMITFSVSGTITLGSTLPDITDAAGLTIDGAGQTVTISGDSLYRVLYVIAGASLNMNNVTIANGNGSFGGGITNDGTLTVLDSTFSDNISGVGGGIHNGASGILTVTNSTFSGNFAAWDFGGGIHNEGSLTITSSTFSYNHSMIAAGVNNHTGGTMTLLNTILANNIGGNCGGNITNGGNNIDDGITCGWGSANGSMSSTDPLLGWLADNGGPTQTFALLPGSPAIDGVIFNAPNSAPSTDQRGVARPQGVRYDIGAFESEAQAGPAFVVNTSADTDDSSCDLLGQGIGNQDCTLREAIKAANAIAGANTITFGVSGPITLGSTLPEITDWAGLTIDGTGQTVTISGNGLYQVLSIDASAVLTLDTLTIANGWSFFFGGGIFNEGSLTIENSTLSGNSSSDFGGGIFSLGTQLTIMNSTFSDNSASSGGGIANVSSGTLIITNSTFSGNNAVSDGGGIVTYEASITNSTFSGNSAVTGGGIYSSGGTVALLNTIVANSSSGGNCSGTITNGGNNIDDGTTCGWGSADGSMSSTDPLLGALANNSGPTQTFALLTGSPAIDGVTFNAPNGAPSTDQRGVARPQGVRYDIGAYESEFLCWIFLPLIMR
jgi:CSLREA domain-containing protein